MTLPTRMTTERLTAMITHAKIPAWHLDQAFWARDRMANYPLATCDLEDWEGSVREGDPAAQAISDPGALLRHLENRWPGSRLKIAAQDGRAHVALLITGLPIGVEGEFKGEVSLTDIGRAIAVAFLKADDMAVSLQRRLHAVHGLADHAPPYREWPVEEVEPGRFAAVHHALRLLCATANSAEGAARQAGMNHKGDHGLMLCRERYEARFPVAGSELAAGAPAMPTAEDPLVWMVGTRDSVLRDAYKAGPDNAPDILQLAMTEGEILIGKDRRGEVRIVREMGPDGLVDVAGGLDALRANDGPEP